MRRVAPIDRGDRLSCDPAHPEIGGSRKLFSATSSAQGLYVADVVRASLGQRHDVIRLQKDLRGAATQTPVAVALAKLLELPGRKVAATGVPRGPPPTPVVGLELFDRVGVVLAPPFAARDNFYAIAPVILAFVRGGSKNVSLRPGLLVCGYLLLVLFLIFLRASIRHGRLALDLSPSVYCWIRSRRFLRTLFLTHDLHLPVHPSKLRAAA